MRPGRACVRACARVCACTSRRELTYVRAHIHRYRPEAGIHGLEIFICSAYAQGYLAGSEVTPEDFIIYFYFCLLVAMTRSDILREIR